MSPFESIRLLHLWWCPPLWVTLTLNGKQQATKNRVRSGRVNYVTCPCQDVWSQNARSVKRDIFGSNVSNTNTARFVSSAAHTERLRMTGIIRMTAPTAFRKWSRWLQTFQRIITFTAIHLGKDPEDRTYSGMTATYSEDDSDDEKIFREWSGDGYPPPPPTTGSYRSRGCSLPNSRLKWKYIR